MLQFTVSGVLINAASFQQELIIFSFEEVKRLITTIQELPFEIYTPIGEVVNAGNIDNFKDHEYDRFFIDSKKVNEAQILLNGTVVKARALRNRYIEISFEEAERLVRATPELPFKIIGHYGAFTIENIDIYRRDEYERFYIQPLDETETFNTADMENELERVGLKCIQHIKTQLERLGGLIDYQEENYREEVLFPTAGHYGVNTLKLAKDEVVADIYWIRSSTRTLSDLFTSKVISVDELYAILKGLRDMKALEIHHLKKVNETVV